MTNLLAFLDKMGGDAACREDYKARPLETMKRFGLGEAECAMIMGGDSESIRASMNPAETQLVITIHFPDSGEFLTPVNA